jgi:predicted MPP superfamily phosphohydrolase
LRSLGSLVGLAAATGFYTWRIEPHWLELVRRPLPIRGLPDALDGCVLAQISDVHVGRVVDDDYVLETFARVATLRPDIVVLTGDLMSWHRAVFEQLRRVYQNVPRGRLATLATLGNHDYGPRWSRADLALGVIDAVAPYGVTFLRNEAHDVEGLQIVGMDDLWAKRFQPEQALAALDPKRPALALSHNPDTVDLPRWNGFRGWILAGHTHGGQCKPPFLPPPLLPVRNKRYTSGEFALTDDRTLYVNRGVGHLLKVRFNVRPEVTLFELHPA